LNITKRKVYSVQSVAGSPKVLTGEIKPHLIPLALYNRLLQWLFPPGG
jgi:hypothetical protein